MPVTGSSQLAGSKPAALGRRPPMSWRLAPIGVAATT